MSIGLLSDMLLLFGKRMVSLFGAVDLSWIVWASSVPQHLLSGSELGTQCCISSPGEGRACLVYMTISVTNSGSRVRFIDCSCGAEKGSLEQRNVNLVRLSSQPPEV